MGLTETGQGTQQSEPSPLISNGGVNCSCCRTNRGPVVLMQGSKSLPDEAGLGLGLYRSLSLSLSQQQPRLPPQYQRQVVPMAGRPPFANPHYNPQQFAAAAASTTASPMMMAQQQQQRPVQMQQQQQQQVPKVLNQVQARQKPNQGQTPPTHYIGAMQQQSLGPARQGVPLANQQLQQQQQQQTLQQQQHLNAQQRLGPQQQQQAMARQTPGQQMMQNQGNTMLSRGSPTGAQMQGAVPAAAAQQQPMYTMAKPAQYQQQQTLQQQHLNAQQRLGPQQQQQAMARQTPGQQMMQNQGNTMLSRGSSTGAQMQGAVPAAVQQQPMYTMGKPAQYQQQQPQQQQQQPQQQQQARPQMVTASMATNQARPGTPAQTNTNAHPSSVPPMAANNTEPLDATGSILGKRSIQDLIAQIDPRERLDLDVEEVLLEIADDFIESVASFAVKLAKHRKSNVLEAKDVLLHLDRQWNITVPGFSGDEYRSYKRPSVSETHKQRLAVVRKSAAAGQAAAAETRPLSAAAAAPPATPVKSGLSGLATGAAGSPSPSPGMPRIIPRV